MQTPQDLSVSPYLSWRYPRSCNQLESFLGSQVRAENCSRVDWEDECVFMRVSQIHIMSSSPGHNPLTLSVPCDN
ncbi:hypothetical protein ABKN59_008900 [Abortiporus biennis]